MPFRLLHETLDAVVGAHGGAKGSGDLLQGLFDVWRELQVSGCCASAAKVLLGVLATAWQALGSRDQALLAPFLMGSD